MKNPIKPRKLKVRVFRKFQAPSYPPIYLFECPLCDLAHTWNYDSMFVKLRGVDHLIDYHKVAGPRIKLKVKDIA